MVLVVGGWKAGVGRVGRGSVCGLGYGVRKKMMEEERRVSRVG